MPSLLDIQHVQPTLAPIRVALVSVGIDIEGGQRALAQWPANISTIDLSGTFDMGDRDATTIARRHGQSVRSQRVVMGHSRFVAAVLSCLRDSSGGPAGRLRVHLRIANCGTIADVVCRDKNNFLKSMVVEFNGQDMPAFGCMHWPLATVDVNDIDRMVHDIVS